MTPNIYFYSPQAFEPWDFRNPDTVGIGGSETAAVEMAWRLARRGYKVICYAPVPDDCPGEWRGTTWRHCKDADLAAPGVWVLSRCPEALDEVGRHPGQEAWLVCQDEDYPGKLTPGRQARLTRLVALCNSQASAFAAKYPALRSKICVSSNGLKPELVGQVLAEGHARNPLRLMYASSPDRALVPLLTIFSRVREFVPEAELHVSYGFDNMDKVVERVVGKPTKEKGDEKFLLYVERLKAALKGPGIVWHGRMPQADLYREWAKSGLWVYPCSRFRETSCITSMEAQALGAVPVVSPLWAVGENVHYGVAVDGDHGDSLTIARFVSSVVALLQDPGRQEAIRREMMPEARRIFTYERFVDQYEAWLHGWLNGERAHEQQHAFHLRHLSGRVLNVGCNDDAGQLGRHGVNVDVMKGKDPWTGRELRPDVVADARDLPAELYWNYDTVVLSDVLEHFDDEGAVRALEEAVRCLRPGGRVTITVPEDYRSPTDQHGPSFDFSQQYTEGVYAYHWRPCTKEIVEGWLAQAGLRAVYYRPIDYGFTWGHGFVCEPDPEAEPSRAGGWKARAGLGQWSDDVEGEIAGAVESVAS